MSLILDALKRAERERRAGQTPMPLDALPITPAEPANGGARRWLLPALLGAIVAGGAVYALLLWHRPAAAPPAAPVIAAATPAAAPASPPAAPMPEAAAPTAPPEPAGTASGEAAVDDNRIATLDDLVDDRRPPADAQRPAPRNPPPDGDAHIGRPSPTSAPVPANGRSSPTEALPPFEQPVGPPAPEPPPPAAAPAPHLNPGASPPSTADEAAAAPTAATDAPPGPGAEAPATSLKDMSPNFRSEFPAFTVDVHVYNDDPARRFVMLNGRRYHEGDVTAEGPRIAGIVSEGIIFEWRGERVLYSLTR